MNSYVVIIVSQGELCHLCGSVAIMHVGAFHRSVHVHVVP